MSDNDDFYIILPHKNGYTFVHCETEDIVVDEDSPVFPTIEKALKAAHDSSPQDVGEVGVEVAPECFMIREMYKDNDDVEDDNVIKLSSRRIDSRVIGKFISFEDDFYKVIGVNHYNNKTVLRVENNDFPAVLEIEVNGKLSFYRNIM